MKFSLTIFILTASLIVQSAHSSPSPLLGSIFDAFGNIVSGIGGAVNGAIEGGVNVGTEILKGGLNVAGSIGSGITNTITGTLVGGANSLADISRQTQDTLLNSINSLTNGMVSRNANQFKDRIDKVQQQAEAVINSAEDKLKQLDKRMSASIDAAEISLATWSDQQKEKISNLSNKTEVGYMIDDLIAQSIEKSRQCTETIRVPVEDVIAKVKNSTESTFPIIDEVIAKIDFCAALGSSATSTQTMQCSSQIKAKTDSLLPYSRQLNDFQRQLSRISVDTLTNSCVGKVNNEVKQKLQDMEAQIDEMVKNS